MTSHKPSADQWPARICSHVWAPLPWMAAGSTGHHAEEEGKGILEDVVSWWHSEGDSLFCQFRGQSAMLGSAILEKRLGKSFPWTEARCAKHMPSPTCAATSSRDPIRFKERKQDMPTPLSLQTELAVKVFRMWIHILDIKKRAFNLTWQNPSFTQCHCLGILTRHVCEVLTPQTLCRNTRVGSVYLPGDPDALR